MTREEIIKGLGEISVCQIWEDEVIDEAIKALEQEPKTGHWIEHYNPEAEPCMQYMSECSLCGKMICGRYNPYKNFCPNCGAEMEKEQKTT